MKKRIFLICVFICACFALNTVFAQTDATASIVNPEFDTNSSGWTVSGITTSTNKISTTAKGDGSVILGGQGHWQIYCSGTGKAYQIVTGLPKGRYTVKVGLFSHFAGTLNLYANGGKTVIQTDKSAYYEVDGQVTTDTLEIGLQIAFTGASTTNNIEFDHVTLTYYSLSELSTILTQKKSIAESLLSKRMQNSVKTDLSNAIAQVQTALNANPQNEENNNLAINNITVAIDAANISILTFKNLKNAIDSASLIYGNGSGISAETLQTSIATAQSAYDNLDTTNPDLNAATTLINIAIRTYFIANASNSNPLDLTNSIINPNFNSGSTGWKTTTGASNTGTFVAETKTGLPSGYGDFKGNVWENWKSSKLKGKMYQLLTGMPNGKYTLSASVYALKNWTDVYSTPAQDWLFLYANSGVISVTDPKLCLSYTTVGYVNDGNLEIGINIADTVTNWFAVDNFKLTYFGYDIPEAVSYLQSRISVASNLQSAHIFINVFTELQTSISDANNALSNPTQTNLESAASKLNAAISATNASIASYASLSNVIESANTNITTYQTFPGYTTFNNAISFAKNGYDSKSWDDKTIASEIAKLKTAETICRLTQPAPFDATFALQNPSFEEGTFSTTFNGKTYNTPLGWSLSANCSATGTIDSKKTTTNPHDGLNAYNIWSNSVVDIDLNQDVILPPGSYELSSMMRSESVYTNGNQTIYVMLNDNIFVSKSYEFSLDVLTTEWNTLLAWMPLTISFEVKDVDSTVKIGAFSYSDGTTPSGWFQIDNFRLNMTQRYETSIKNHQTSDDVNAKGVSGGVSIKTTQQTDVNIYNVMGQLVKAVKVKGEKFVDLEPGLYFVNHLKVFVK